MGTDVKPFRFGSADDADTAEGVIANARAAEAAGFDVVTTYDHVLSGPGAWSPLTPVVAMAAAATTIRVGTLGLNKS